MFNSKSETAIAMAISSAPQRAGFPLTLALSSEALPKPSWVKISQVRTISIERLGKRIAALDAETLGQVVDGLIELIGLRRIFQNASAEWIPSDSRATAIFLRAVLWIWEMRLSLTPSMSPISFMVMSFV